MTTNNDSNLGTTPYKIKSMPIGSAFKWFKNAWLLIKTQPWIQFSTVSWLLITLILLSLALPSVPVVGFALAALVLPALSFGMADVNQKIRLQQTVSLFDVFSGLHPNHRTRLLAIGAFLALLLFASFSALHQFDLSPITRFYEDFAKQAETIAPEELLQKFDVAKLDPAFIKAVVVVDLFAFLNLLLLALLAYAPLFVVWQGAQPFQAIGLSLLTVAKNILPLFVLSILILAILIVLYIALALILVSVPFIALWLAFPISFLFVAFLFALVFSSYHNIITNSVVDTAEV